MHSAGLRIGVDGYNLALPRGTGVATYGRSLVHALAGLGHTVDALYGLPIEAVASPLLREVEFFDLLQNERGGRVPKFPSVGWARSTLETWRGVSAFPIPITGTVIPGNVASQLPPFDRVYNATTLFHRANRFFRSFGRFAQVRLPDPPAIMHWTYPIPVHAIGSRNIYTIHDLVPVRLPYTTLDHKPTYLKLIAECLRCGDHIVTVSDTSRADILQAFPGASPDRITNTYQCVVPAVQRPLDEVQRMVRAFDLEPGRYFLFFGSIEPKKNLGRLLEAFLSADLGMPLVIIGGRSWRAEQELALLQHRPEGDRRIRQIDYVSPEVLGKLVTAARAVTFPSLYEGFGLPLLEAMAAGTPVLASSAGALPEIAGDAALLIDPYDVGAIAAALERLAVDDALCTALSARGTARASAFSMDRYQARLGPLYERVLGAQQGAAEPGIVS